MANGTGQSGVASNDPLRPARSIYLGLCVAGTVVPYWQLLPFIRDHGLDVKLMVSQLFATPVSAFFGADVIVSSVVLWSFVAFDGRGRRPFDRWAPIVANLAVGVSLGLPLYLYLRERDDAGAR